MPASLWIAVELGEIRLGYAHAFQAEQVAELPSVTEKKATQRTGFDR